MTNAVLKTGTAFVSSNMKERSNKKRTVVFLIIAAVFATAAVIAALMLYKELQQSKKEADTFAELAAMRLPKEEADTGESNKVETTPRPSPVHTAPNKDQNDGVNEQETEHATEEPEEAAEETTVEEEACEPTPMARYLPLYERNRDLFAWITIPGTVVNYPVMYTPEEPLRYLEKDFYGRFSYAGVPFLDSECKPNGNIYLIYGHRMVNGSMFAGLVAYKSKAFWKNHQYIEFDTLYEERTYIIIIAMEARVLASDEQDGFRYYNYTSLDTESDFQAYMQQAEALAMYDTGLNASYGDELLVLSTCDNHTQDGRFVIIAKRIS